MCESINPQPFRFDQQGDSSQKDTPRDVNSDHQLSPHQPLRGWNCNRHRRDQGLPPPQPHCCPQIADLKAIGVWCQQPHQCCYCQTSQKAPSIPREVDDVESQSHIKINLPIFKDKDTEDAVTYQSWRWDLTVYHHVGCQDLTLLLYTIQSSQSYSRELVQSSGIDITLDDVLMILDKHYNNMKAVDALNQELFQLQMADKETVSDWGIHLSRHLQVLAAFSLTISLPTMWLS